MVVVFHLNIGFSSSGGGLPSEHWLFLVLLAVFLNFHLAIWGLFEKNFNFWFGIAADKIVAIVLELPSKISNLNLGRLFREVISIFQRAYP